MNMTDSSHNNFPSNDWQILGELELSIGSSAAGLIHARLSRTLEPLDLHTDFLNKILVSAQDAAVRASQAETVMKFGHIHISIFVPHEHASKGKTWGFFHIERIENPSEGAATQDHAIDFYLYVEGE